MSWLKGITKGLDDYQVPVAEISGAFTHDHDITYQIYVGNGGPSGVATVDWRDSDGHTGSNVIVTSGAAIAVGAYGLSFTLTFPGRLMSGLGWAIKARVASGTFDEPVLYAAAILERELGTPLRVNSRTGALRVEGFLTNPDLPAVQAVEFEDDVNGVTPLEITFGGDCIAYEITLTTTTSEYIEISNDGGTNYLRKVFQRGTYSWNPPGSYSNDNPLTSIFVRGSAAGTYHIEITAWIISAASAAYPPLTGSDFQETVHGQAVTYVDFSGSAHAYQITLTSAVLTNILVSYDNVNWVRTVGARGTYYWQPPAGYANGAPITGIYVKGEDNATDYDIDVTAWLA